MARFRDIISNFLSGEVHPRLHGRTDVAQFKSSAEEITNMIVEPQGGVLRRTGTYYLSDFLKTKSYFKLIPFVKSKTNSYVIVLTEGTGILDCVHVWDVANGGFLSITDPTWDNSYLYILNQFNSTLNSWPRNIHWEQFGNGIFVTHEGVPFAIDFSPLNSGGNVVVYAYWHYAMLGSSTALQASVLQQADASPFDDPNSNSLANMQVSAVTGNITITCDVPEFTPLHPGALIRITDDIATTTGVAVITSYVSSTVVNAHVFRDFGNTNKSLTWALSAWNRVSGWPKSVTFFENRISYGYITGDPNACWQSKSGDVSFMRQEQYIDETPFGVTNADAWSFRISGGEYNIIEWIKGGKTFFIGTAGEEINGFGPDATLGFGPLNFEFNKNTTYGSASVQPLRRDNTVMFVQRTGKMLRELLFYFQENGYKAYKIMTHADHMLQKTQGLSEGRQRYGAQIVEIAHQEGTNQITWFRDSLGGLFTMSRDKEAEGSPTAFSYHKISGSAPNNGVDPDSYRISGAGEVMSICSCPSFDNSNDDIYLIVKRAFGGSNYSYLERIGRPFEVSVIDTDAIPYHDYKPIFVDSALVLDPVGVAGDNISGLTHLVGNGLEVQLLADGKYWGSFAVDNTGTITVPGFSTDGEIIAGLAFRSQLIPMELNMGSVIGTPSGADRTIDRAIIRFIRTIGAKFGLAFDGVIDENQMYDVIFRDPEAPPGDPIELFTGEKELTPPMGYATKMNVVIRQDLPFPLYVANIVVRGLVND